MTKTLIYSNTGLTSWQIGINTEVIDQLNIEDREILIINCDATLPNCYFNQTHNPIGCALCQSRQKVLLKQAGISEQQIDNLKPYEIDKSLCDVHFDTLKDLMQYSIDNTNIGRGVASSIISYTRDYKIHSGKYGRLIETEIKKSITVLYNFQRFIKDFQPDEIYLFNGRFSEVWPVLQLAEKHNIKYFCIEAGSPGKYELFENSLPHSIKERHQTISQLWNEGEKQKILEGEQWFKKRRFRTNTGEIQFTSGQEKDKIPLWFDTSKKNIVLFNSSEDELKAIQEWAVDFFDNQNEAIKCIVEHFSDKPDYQFILRVHPNLSKVNNAQLDEINTFNYANLKIIGPDEDIDTYKLMDIADKVISFGSTTGIEATFWGATSILFGKSFYMHLDAAYQPNSYKSLYNLIQDSSLAPKNKENTLPYGHYMLKYGSSPYNFSVDQKGDKYYKNSKIKKFYPRAISLFIQYLPKSRNYFSLAKILYGKFGWLNILRFKT